MRWLRNCGSGCYPCDCFYSVLSLLSNDILFYSRSSKNYTIISKSQILEVFLVLQDLGGSAALGLPPP